MYVVKYTGPFGFIKPWTAVRDSETYSQQFLTQSIVTGMERKLFPKLLRMNSGEDDGEIKRILGHRISYKQISLQQEQTQPRGWNSGSHRGEKTYTRDYSILTRGVLIEPVLWLSFMNRDDAQKAAQDHIHLCRNEDILYPAEEVFEVTQEEFDSNEERFAGFELVFEHTDNSFLVGFNRFKENQPMYGSLKVVGTPVKNSY